MDPLNINYPRTTDQITIASNTLIRQDYAWMGGGLLVTALLTMVTVSSPAILNAVFGNRLVFYGLILGELGLVVAISGAINRLSAATASLLFLLYAALNGVTMSVIYVAYTAESVTSTFVITAATFGSMSAFGYLTKRDLTGWGSFLFMGLIGVVIASLVNIFTQSSAVSWIISPVGVIVFTGLTAYDTQKIKAMAATGAEGRKPAILGALTLYSTSSTSSSCCCGSSAAVASPGQGHLYSRPEQVAGGSGDILHNPQWQQWSVSLEITG